jgi:hypothetical protein
MSIQLTNFNANIYSLQAVLNNANVSKLENVTVARGHARTTSLLTSDVKTRPFHHIIQNRLCSRRFRRSPEIRCMFKFGIRALLLITGTIAIVSAYIGRCLWQSKQQDAAMAAIDALGVQSGADISMSVDDEDSLVFKFFAVGVIEKLWIARNREGGSLSCIQLAELGKFHSLRSLCLSAPIDECSGTPKKLQNLAVIEMYDLTFEEAKQTLQSLSIVLERRIEVDIRSSELTSLQLDQIEKLPFVGEVRTSEY